MSVEAVKWAMYDAPHLITAKGKPDTTARAVLSVLAEHANKRGGNAFAGPGRIRFATGYNERTIRHALDRLEDAKLIERDGVTHQGATRWKLALSTVRPESDWAAIQADAEAAKRSDADRQRTHRQRQVSMHRADVTHSDAVTSVRRLRDVRTQTTDVTHSTPTEPPRNHQRTTKGTTNGGAPPPHPRGPGTPTGPRNEQTNSLPADQDQPLDAVSNHRPHARGNSTADHRRPSAPGKRLTCEHGKPIRFRRDGQSRCSECRDWQPSNTPATDVLADTVTGNLTTTATDDLADHTATGHLASTTRATDVLAHPTTGNLVDRPATDDLAGRTTATDNLATVTGNLTNPATDDLAEHHQADTHTPPARTPAKCPHGLTNHRRDDGTHTCAICRRAERTTTA